MALFAFEEPSTVDFIDSLVDDVTLADNANSAANVEFIVKKPRHAKLSPSLDALERPHLLCQRDCNPYFSGVLHVPSAVDASFLLSLCSLSPGSAACRVQGTLVCILTFWLLRDRSILASSFIAGSLALDTGAKPARATETSRTEATGTTLVAGTVEIAETVQAIRIARTKAIQAQNAKVQLY